MDAEDQELTEAMDTEVTRQLPTVPQLVTAFQTTFGSADTTLTQQWIGYGLAQHSEDVSTVVSQDGSTVTPEKDVSMAVDVEIQEDTGSKDEESDKEADVTAEEEDVPVDSGYKVKDLPKNTKVVLIDHHESFYGAVGTVRGAVSETEVSVVFDVKPTTPYNVPAAHLDIERDVEHATRILKDSGGLWTFNGVPSLVTFLRAKEGENGQWAFIGSVALSYWAREYKVTFRHPHDMDIVVNSLNAWYYDFGLAVNGTPGRPSMTADHRTLELSMCNLDIIANGKGLGDFGSGPITVGGVPVVDLETIKKYKKKRGEPKDLADLKVIDHIIGLRDKK
ncbi:MAG TPA: hypothetical protein VHV49_17890 [Pseudonocardiaceae bacterium]|jgi:hypothetical protein|nr:hypothetical protein [Pseudonocardiaceae bacterium]